MSAGDPQWSREALLDLFASYLPHGRESVRQIQNELSLARRGSFRTPEKILIILFASRAGSNYLGQLLSSTGWFNEIGESFRPGQLAKIRDRFGLSDLHDAAQWMIDHRGTPQAFGLKAGLSVLTAAAEIAFLPEVLDRTRFVLLRRRDRVAQAVSLVKGKLSGQMHSLQPVARVLDDDDYDAQAIAAQVAQIEQRENQYAVLVERFGKAAPVLYYEDICARPQQHVTVVCEHLELSMPADYEPRVRLSVLRDDLNARWTKRFRSEGATAE
jgi:LPS sulfotransferase NodH